MGSSAAWTALPALLALPLAAARPQDAPPEASIGALRAAVAESERAVEEERASLEALRARLAEEAAASRARRETLARELLDASVALEAQRGEAAAREGRAREAAARAGALVGQARGALAGAGTAAERLAIHLREVPGADAAREAARALGARLRAALERLPAADAPGYDAGAPAEAPWAELGALLAGTLADAARVGVRDARIWSARGAQEDVRLLSLGHLRFAYETADGRAALALASPADASGYRWSEALEGSARDAVRAAVAAAASGAAWVDVPLDPTGALRADHARPDLAAQVRSGGPLMVPLGLVLLVAAGLTLERLLALFVQNPRGAGPAREVLAAAARGRIDEARHAARAARGTVARTLAACLERRAQGQRAMEDAISEQLLHEAPRLQRSLKTLALLAGVAPLLGLLGTVTGIIQTFGVIRTLGSADPSLLASGISVALVTTAGGLSIAIPVLLVQGFLRGRGERILADAERHAASLLVILSHGAPEAERG